ncbi:MAG TPA: hypothetical protein VMV57_04070 [Terracidiphilus sp.]|nr:hypothetical protein [Terracidiphilus sp.]
MILLLPTVWRAAIGITVLAGAVSAGVWLVFRKRPSADELERARRKLLSQSGRLVDGMLLDIYDMEAADGRTRTLLVFSYRIGGVEYECSQDVSGMLGTLNPSELPAGFPCSVRYQPGNPHNSIVIAEAWSGIRASMPAHPISAGPGPVDLPQPPAQR